MSYAPCDDTTSTSAPGWLFATPPPPVPVPAPILLDLVSDNDDDEEEEKEEDPFAGILALYGYDEDDDSDHPEDIAQGRAARRQHLKANAADPTEALFNPVRPLESYIAQAKFDRQGELLRRAKKTYKGLSPAQRARDEARFLAQRAAKKKS